MNLSELEDIPKTYNDLIFYFGNNPEINPFSLREETMSRIEAITERPLICYVTRTVNVPLGVPTSIDDSDLVGFNDLIDSISDDKIDVFIVSNGGLPESTERIVRLLRDKFTDVRFIIPGNAFSAATMLSFSGDEILMGNISTLGPIDPQIGGVPAKLILKGFTNVQELLEDNPTSITAYMPLLEKYDLPILEFCKTAQKLSRELAMNWLSKYMFKCSKDDEEIKEIVKFFCDYDTHKSHGRSIDFKKAEELKLKVKNLEEMEIGDLVYSLFNQYELWFWNTSFYKIYENSRGVNWGRQSRALYPPESMIDPDMQNPAVSPTNPQEASK